jgi:hypothetical protein
LVSPISSSADLLMASDMPTAPTARARVDHSQRFVYRHYFP